MSLLTKSFSKTEKVTLISDTYIPKYLTGKSKDAIAEERQLSESNLFVSLTFFLCYWKIFRVMLHNTVLKVCEKTEKYKTMRRE